MSATKKKAKKMSTTVELAKEILALDDAADQNLADDGRMKDTQEMWHEIQLSGVKLARMLVSEQETSDQTEQALATTIKERDQCQAEARKSKAKAKELQAEVERLGEICPCCCGGLEGLKQDNHLLQAQLSTIRSQRDVANRLLDVELRRVRQIVESVQELVESD